MDTKSYCMKASEYLHRFCDVKPNRRTGSQGNKEAIAYFADIISQLGYTVDTEPFPALDYRMDYVLLTNAQQSFEVYVSPYSLGCAISTELVAVATVEELESISCKDKLLLLKEVMGVLGQVGPSVDFFSGNRRYGCGDSLPFRVLGEVEGHVENIDPRPQSRVVTPDAFTADNDVRPH